MTQANVVRASNGQFASPSNPQASATADADVEAISTPDPRANGSDAASANGAGNGSGGGEGPQEARARRLGWQPQEKFRGPKDKWLDADAFVEKAESDLPVLRERLRFQDKFIQDQQTKLGSLEDKFGKTQTLLEEVTERLRMQDERGLSHVVQQLEAEMDAAVADADTERYQKAKRRLVELGQARAPRDGKAEDKSKQPSPQPQPQKVGPELEMWMRENPWFNPSDPEDDASLYAVRQDMKLSRKNPYMSDRERLDKVRESVERRFPELFENTNRRQAAAVNSPSPHRETQRKPKQKTVSDLDDDQKAALAAIQKRDPKFKAEDYLKYLK